MIEAYKEGLKELDENNQLVIKVKGQLNQKEYEQEITINSNGKVQIEIISY